MLFIYTLIVSLQSQKENNEREPIALQTCNYESLIVFFTFHGPLDLEMFLCLDTLVFSHVDF